MAYTTNRFCWHGLMTTDPEKAAVFYQEAIGWKATEMTMGGNTATMFTESDIPFAHYMAPPMEGVPSHWSNYIRVDDVDASTKACVENGGKVIVEPNDIPPGRFSVVTSPSGASINLFHEADESASEHHPGAIHWTELHSKDVDKDLEWIKAVFGFEIGEMPMPNDSKYYLLKDGEEMRGGVMATMMPPEAPSAWLSWVKVDDADAAVKRITNNGGKAFGELMDMPGVGRMCVVSDPTGAVFGVIKPAAPPS